MLNLLTQICSIPTAPFCEDRVIAFVESFVKKYRKLKLTKDKHGNRLILLPGTTNGPRTIMVAHGDHPGFIAETMIDSKNLKARFHGGVAQEYFAKSKVIFFNGKSEIAGRVTTVDIDEHKRPISATIRISQSIPTGTLGMWDQGIGRIKGKRFYSRVCDDLAGVAAGLSVIATLHAKPVKNSVALLLTRAEEEGFIGAIAAVNNKQLLKKTDRIISIECSAEQPYAQQGHGTIIRTGDRTSIFNSAYSRFLHNRAEAISKIDKQFQYQRALMPGGTCEATVFDAWNYCAAAVCVPLGNYHNMDRKTGKIGPEYVHIDDWQNLVKLLTDVSREGHTFDGTMKELQERLTRRYHSFEKYL